MKPLKILAVVCIALLIILAGTVAAIRFFFPADQIRKQLERTLSEHLQGTVRIAVLEWDLLHGIRLSHVEIERDGSRLARFDRLSLRYRLLPLLHGTLAVDELALIQADIFVDLALFPAPSQAEPPPRRDEPVVLPACHHVADDTGQLHSCRSPGGVLRSPFYVLRSAFCVLRSTFDVRRSWSRCPQSPGRARGAPNTLTR